MKIVYTCYGGAHSSPIAAAIHLENLPVDRVPKAEELLQTRYYDKVDSVDHGKILSVGKDVRGNDVFVLGRGSSGTIALNAVRGGWMLAGKSDKDLLLVDTLPTVNWWMRLGGFLSRSLGLVSLGRPLVLFGTRKAYFQLVDLVKQTKTGLGTQNPGNEGDGRG